jgi:hypothetical protein
VFLTALAGGNATHHVGAVGDRLFGVEGALFAGKTLTDYSGVFINEDTHNSFPVSGANIW